MPSVEKALMKAAMADELAAELVQAVANAERNGIATAASRDTMERLFARVAGYKTRIDKACEDGTFPEAAREPVYAVFTDLVRLVQDSHRTLVQVAAEQGPFAAGLRKAHSMAVERAGRERVLAARAAELDAEEAASTKAVRESLTEPPVSPADAMVAPSGANSLPAADGSPQGQARLEGGDAQPDAPAEGALPEAEVVPAPRRVRRPRAGNA